MLVIAKIRHQTRQLCCDCDRRIDLRGGGLYFHRLLKSRLYPICPWCTAEQDSALALAGALYGQAALSYNEDNPDSPLKIAILQAIPALETELEAKETAEA